VYFAPVSVARSEMHETAELDAAGTTAELEALTDAEAGFDAAELEAIKVDVEVDDDLTVEADDDAMADGAIDKTDEEEALTADTEEFAAAEADRDADFDAEIEPLSVLETASELEIALLVLDATEAETDAEITGASPDEVYSATVFHWPHICAEFPGQGTWQFCEGTCVELLLITLPQLHSAISTLRG